MAKRRVWTSEECAKVRRWAEKGWSHAEMGRSLGRTAVAVKQKLCRMGVASLSSGGRLLAHQIAVALGVDPEMVRETWPKYGLRTYHPRNNKPSTWTFVEPGDLEHFLQDRPEAAPLEGRNPRLIRRRLGFWQGLPDPVAPARYKRVRCCCDWVSTVPLFELHPMCESCRKPVCYLAYGARASRYTDEPGEPPIGTPWERTVWEATTDGQWRRTAGISVAATKILPVSARRHARIAARSLEARGLCETVKRNNILWVRRCPGAQPRESE